MYIFLNIQIQICSHFNFFLEHYLDIVYSYYDTPFKYIHVTIDFYGLCYMLLPTFCIWELQFGVFSISYWETIACYLLHGICSLFYFFKTTKCIRFLLIGTLRRYVVDMTLRGDRLLMSIKIFLTKDLVKSHYTMSMIYICLFFMSPSLLWKGNYDPQEHAVRLNKS